MWLMGKGIWMNGSAYRRGGVLKSKWGTTRKEPVSYRDKNTGVVVSPSGRIAGIEETHHHNWGDDPKAKKGLRKPYAFVKGHSRKGSPVRNHTRKL